MSKFEAHWTENPGKHTKPDLAYMKGFDEGRQAIRYEFEAMDRALNLERRRVNEARARLGWVKGPFGWEAPKGWVPFECDKRD